MPEENSSKKEGWLRVCKITRSGDGYEILVHVDFLEGLTGGFLAGMKAGASGDEEFPKVFGSNVTLMKAMSETEAYLNEKGLTGDFEEWKKRKNTK